MNSKKLFALLVLALGACTVDNKSSLVVRGRAVPQGGECTFSPAGQFWLGPGVLDVGPAYDAFLNYSLVAYIDNRMSVPPNGSTTTGGKAWRGEAARVRLNPSGYVSDFTPSPPLLDVAGENTTPLNGQIIEANGQGVMDVTAVSHELGLMIQGAAQALAPGDVRQVILGINFQGHTMDGEYLETGEWIYPVTVCVDCLTNPAQLTCATGEAAALTTCTGPGQDAGFACVRVQ